VYFTPLAGTLILMKNLKSKLVLLGLFTLSTGAFAGEAVPEHPPILGTFELSPTGSFSAYTKQPAPTIWHMKDGSFAARSIDIPVASLVTGLSLRDEHMKNKYLEVQKYPKASLTRLKAKGGKFEGLMNLHGKSQKVSGEYKIVGNQVRAEFPLKLSEYGIVIPTYMGVGVEDEGKMEVNLPYKNQ
jgi:polyisoprenoid-binding protein YceI